MRCAPRWQKRRSTTSMSSMRNPQRLESAESWQKIEQSDRDRILKGLNIAKATKGVTGTEQEVLESLERISLDAWRIRTAALPQFFAEARIQADKLVEPKTPSRQAGQRHAAHPRGGQGLGDEDRAGIARAAQARPHRRVVGAGMKTLSTEHRRQLRTNGHRGPRRRRGWCPGRVGGARGTPPRALRPHEW